ncbi:hypothetical protein ACFPYN_10195 [Paenisporosarcina macmurdoensis]|uniref:Uncharacterized protein n=1 Tax=Paenisporosarcina macmurdoensis TaxID=212659 RepID=A0ABW1L8T3_9BACL
MELGGNWIVATILVKVATITLKVTIKITKVATLSTKVATIENLEQHLKNGHIDLNISFINNWRI